MSVNFRQRSPRLELLDQPGIPPQDIAQNMQELGWINRHLGGHAINISAVKKMLRHTRQVHICELGCGGGDNLQAIYNYYKRRGILVTVTGIDINPDCIDYARRHTSMAGAEWICEDYKTVYFNDKPDLIFSSLFCHHFEQRQLVDMIKYMQANATGGFFINDLHRHPVAYYFIKWATRLFSRSYLVKHDAPLSVLRSFRKEDWIEILNNAGIVDYKIEWRWAFRYLIMSGGNKVNE